MTKTTTTAEPEQHTDEPAAAESPAGDTEPERVSAELVPHQPEPEPSARMAAIDRAADQALMPGAPGRDELFALAQAARILSLSGAAPPAIRNNPYIAFHIAMVGRDMGLSPSAAIQLIDVIGYDSKKPDGGDNMQISLSPQLLNGQIRRLGLGSICKIVEKPDHGVAAALIPSGVYDIRCRPIYPDHVDGCRCNGVLGVTEFSWEDAQVAELVDARCTPSQHHTGDKYEDSGKPKRCRCRGGYRTYPRRMMWWRAAGYCADDYFPEAGMGFYSPEELGATVDADGRALDPSSVDLPDGYAPRVTKSSERGWQGETDERLWADRLAALIDAAGASARERWEIWRDENGVNPAWLLGWTLSVDAIIFAAQHPAATADQIYEAVPVREKLPVTMDEREKFVRWAADKIAAGPVAEDPPPPPTTDAAPDEEAPEAAARPPVPDDPAAQLLESSIAFVQVMKIRDVDYELQRRKIEPDGDEDSRRRALVKELVREQQRERSRAAQASLRRAKAVHDGADADAAAAPGPATAGEAVEAASLPLGEAHVDDPAPEYD